MKRNKSFEDYRENILNKYGTGTDAPYDVLKNIAGGELVIDEYISELISEDDFFIPEDNLYKVAIMKANIIHLITSDQRGKMLFDKFSFYDDFYSFMEGLVYHCLLNFCDINFEWIISFLMRLEINSESILDTIEILNNNVDVEDFIDQITNSIYEDIEYSFMKFDEYQNAHDNDEYNYFNE